MKWILLFPIVFMSGCGTFSTVYKSDEYAVAKLINVKTSCRELPRVYSGVFFDLCQLNSSSENTLKYTAHSFYLFDTIPSALADTVLLPYTIYEQKEKGGLTVSK